LKPTFPKTIILKKFKSRKLLTSVDHNPVKVRWNSIGAKYYSSWGRPLFFSLLIVLG